MIKTLSNRLKSKIMKKIINLTYSAVSKTDNIKI